MFQIMNLKKLTLTITAILSLVVISNVRASVVQILNFNLTSYTQSSVNDDGTATVVAAPKVAAHKTADLLRILAGDEAAAGSWQSNSFPATAKLAVSDNGFFVVNGTNFLV